MAIADTSGNIGDLILQDGLRVGAEYLHHRRLGFEPYNGSRNIIIVLMSIYINKKHVLPQSPA